MKIKTLTLENFMIFDSIDVEWSPNINVILGENSTGKTTLLKAMYSLVKPYGRSDFLKCTQMQQEDMIVGKMVGVFRPDEKKIGRMSSRRRGAPKNTKMKVCTAEGDRFLLGAAEKTMRMSQCGIQKKVNYVILYIFRPRR